MHIPFIAEAVLEITTLREVIFSSFVKAISKECSILCGKTVEGLFRRIPVTKLADITWGAFIEELKSKAPTLLQLMTSVVSVNDHRNTSKVGNSHHPGICAVIAILLKERSREMCGLQSTVSVLMYPCHCEKQVCKCNTFKLK